MTSQKSNTISFVLLSVLLFVVWGINIRLGSVSIPTSEIFKSLLGEATSEETWRYIIIHFRLPKSITAILVGAGLSVSGLLMQTLFRNPLAGPFVLGISSGASLGVALVVLGAGLFGGIFSQIAQSHWGIASAAAMGSALVLLAVVASVYRIRNTMSILIIGLMFGSLTAACISILAYFSDASQIQQYLFWSFGSLGNLSWNEVLIFAVLFGVACIGLLGVIKPLNSLLLGERYAKSVGVNIQKSRLLILGITSILTGVATAFSGPIAFVGLAVPHITKLVFTTSNHKVLLPAVMLIGASLMLICDAIAQLPTSEYTLPINAITSIFGAPVVIWLLVRKKTMYV